jgi:hypothetical protein
LPTVASPSDRMNPAFSICFQMSRDCCLVRAV